jgi:GntR family transcriptional repressor for pyruvate dehydrogenase complex
MTTPFLPVSAGERLSVKVADQLAAQIHSGQFGPGDKLPTEAKLVEQFQVSRTVVREAMSRLKSLGLLESRQGSGVYVSASPVFAPLNFDARHAESKVAVLQMVEVRRALEAEVAGLAARRRSDADVQRIQVAVQQLELAVMEGRNGVNEDVLFHRAIADAAQNPFLISTLDYLAQFLKGATRVTRANEARRSDFMDEVRAEHQAIVDAIQKGDAAAARAAAACHMDNAVVRIELADPSFWQSEGMQLAHPLVSGQALLTGK